MNLQHRSCILGNVDIGILASSRQSVMAHGQDIELIQQKLVRRVKESQIHPENHSL